MQEIRSGPTEVHDVAGHRRGYSSTAIAATALILLFGLAGLAQETRVMWAQIEPLTPWSEIPKVKVASPGVAGLYLDVTGGAQWKSYVVFQHDSVMKGEVGIDYTGAGLNRVYFYGGTTPYLSKWPAVQSAGDKCLHNDGAGDLTWGTCGAAANWTEAAGVIYPTTNTDHVQVGGGATTSELRLMEQSANGVNYVGFMAAATLAGNIVWELPGADATGFLKGASSGTLSFGTTSAHLAGVLSDETGSGLVVFQTDATHLGTYLNIGGGAAATDLRLLEPSGGGANYTGFKAPALAADVMYTLPTADGAASTCLSTNGAKVLSWAACTGGAAGWTDDGSVVRLTTASDQVAIGTATPFATITPALTVLGNVSVAKSSATTYIALGHNNEVGFKSTIAFLNDDSGVFEFGIDVNNNGTNEMYFYDILTAKGAARLAGLYFTIGGSTTASEFRMLEPSASGANYTGFIAPALAANVIYTLPTADGSVNQVLSTSGAKVLSWASVAAHPDPHRLGDGTGTAPTYSFSSDTNSGMFLIGADVLGFIVGGGASAGGKIHISKNVVADTYANLTFMGTYTYAGTPLIQSMNSASTLQPLGLNVTQFVNVAGTEVLPAYAFNGDTNTGIFQDTADTIGFTMAGAGVAGGRIYFEVDPVSTTSSRIRLHGSYTYTQYASIRAESSVGVAQGLYLNSSYVDTDTEYRVANTKVIGARGAAVADAAGGATVDTEARAAINALLARLRTHGLIAP